MEKLSDERKIQILSIRDVNYEKDFLEISIHILGKESEENKELTNTNSDSSNSLKLRKYNYTSNIKLKNLCKTKEREEIWKISTAESINVKYKFSESIVKENEIKLNSEINSLNNSTTPVTTPKTKLLDTSNTNKDANINNSINVINNPFSLTKESQGGDTETKSTNLNTNQLIDDEKSNRPPIIKTSLHPPRYPKKTNSLFSKISKVQFADEKSNLNIPLDKNIKVCEINLTGDKLNSHKTINSSHNNSNTSITRESITYLDYEEVKLNRAYTENKNDIQNKFINEVKYSKDTFCEAFFVAGLPFKDAKVIINSEHLKASCNHKKCNLLPSYKPDIITSLVNERGNNQLNPYINPTFELHTATSYLCFPKGIKVCYHQKESEIQKKTNFLTVTTNENGKRYYIYSYHFYIKMPLHSFKSVYNFDPVTDHNRYNKEVQFLINKLTDPNLSKKESIKLEAKYSENHELCCDLVSSDYVYIPRCICLVSQMAFPKQMHNSLRMILKLSYDKMMTVADINKLILHLIYEIPIPAINKSLHFYLPYMSNSLKLEGRLQKDLPITNGNVSLLFEYFPPDMIVLITHLILLENRVLFIYDDWTTLCDISAAFVSLIYPLNWVNTYIPLLSEEMLKYLKSFMPFIMGLDKDLFAFFQRFEDFDPDSPVYIIWVEPGKKSFMENSERKKMSVKKIYKNLPEMPEEINSIATLALEEVVKLSKSEEFKEEKLNKKIRSLFVKSMVILFGDYKKYVSDIDDSHIFNSESFIASRPEKFRQFYSDLTSTGIFRSFLSSAGSIKNNSEKNLTNNNLNLPSTFCYFEKMCVRYVNSIITRRDVKRLSGSNIRKSILYSDQKAKIKSSNSIRSSSVVRKNLNDNFEKATKISLKLNGSNEINETHNAGSAISSSVSSSISPPRKKIPMNKANTPGPGKSVINMTGCSIEGYSDSQSLNKSNSFTEFEYTKYTIPPYFLNNSIKSVINYEELLSQKFNYANNDDMLNYACNSRIFESDLLKEINFESMPISYKNYVFPGCELNSVNSPIESHKSNSLTPKDETELKNYETTKESINDFLKMIITSEYYTKVESNTILQILNTKYGRNYFSKVLFQSKFLESKTQILNEKGFDDLYHLIFNLLILCETDSSDFGDFMKVTKSTFFYYKLLKGKDQYYIYQEIIKKNPTPFSVWLNPDFWTHWFLVEIKERKNLMQKLEDFYFFILSEMASMMNNMNIDLNTILDCVVNKIAKNYIKEDDTLIGDLEKTIVKQHAYLSRVSKELD